MKKNLYLLMILLILNISLVFGENNCKLIINNEDIELTNSIIIEDNIVLLPLKETLTELGMTIRYDNTTNTIFGYYENDVLYLPLNSKKAIHEVYDFEKDKPIREDIELSNMISIINSQSYISLFDIEKIYDVRVNWDSDNQIAKIMYNNRKIMKKKYSNGFYEGEMRNGIEDGYGKFSWNNGDVFEGNFVNGERGEGVYFKKSTNETIYLDEKGRNKLKTINIDGITVELRNPILIKDDFVLVPIIDIFNKMDISADFCIVEGGMGLFAEYDDVTLTSAVNSNIVFKTIDKYVNNKYKPIVKKIKIEKAMQEIDDTVYSSFRDIEKIYKVKVDWDDKRKLAKISYIRENAEKDFEDGLYIGEFRNEKRDGKGKYFWNDGDSYDGTWKDDKKHGFGIFKCSDGSKYEGHWKNGYMNGEGTIISPNGNIFTGTFYMNSMKKGTFTNVSTGEIIYSNEEGYIIDNSMQNKDTKTINNEFRKKAYDGPNYYEIKKNPSLYLGKPVFFSGKVIQAIESEDGSSMFLVDNSSGANDLLDIVDPYGDFSHVDSQICAIFSNSSIDVLENDNVNFYGNVLQNFSYETIGGISKNIPAMKVVDYENRSQKIREIMEDTFSEKETMDDLFRNNY